jgi:hypothetical protein
VLTPGGVNPAERGELGVEAVGGVMRERGRVDAGRSEPRPYNGRGRIRWRGGERVVVLRPGGVNFAERESWAWRQWVV